MKRLSYILILLILASVARADNGQVTLLLTNPQEEEFHNIKTLVKLQMLQVPGLHVIGIYNKAEHEDYSPARKYLEENKIDWMEIREVDCKLSEDTVYQPNDCSDEFKDLFEKSDGILFPGGSDIPPGLYDEETSLLTVVRNPPRHYFELSFLFHLMGSVRNKKHKAFMEVRPDYFILGICKGMQSMNVTLGGSMVQDIPSEIYRKKNAQQVLKMKPAQIHRNYHTVLDHSPVLTSYLLHPILFKGKSKEAKALTATQGPYQVLSAHHQAVEKLGSGLIVIATSLDGKIPEAVLHKKYKNVLGVQFHPENTLLYDDQLDARLKADDPAGNAIAARYAGDKNIQAFHQAFWKLVSARLTGI